jgi:hypothetical protein
MTLAILFHLLCVQHVSDINISIFRSLRLCWWITTSFCRLQPAKRTPPNTSRNKSSNTQRTENKTTDVVIHQHSRKLLKMDILMSETCWAHNKWNKIASDIRLVFHSSTIAMMHGPINIRFYIFSLHWIYLEIQIYYKLLDSFLFSSNHFHMSGHIFFSISHIIHMC